MFVNYHVDYVVTWLLIRIPTIVSYMTYLVNLVMAEDKAAEPFDLLEQTIEQFVETTRQIGIIVSDVQPGSQGVLNQKM